MDSEESSASQPLLRDDTENPLPVHGNTHRARYHRVQEKVQNFLTSKYQHYCVLGLVTLDIFSIFADVFISLYTCERKFAGKGWDDARDGLGIAGLVFSCLFMFELLLCVWAFGWRYFTSWFHIFDGTVILAGFVIDVLLHGVLEEIASLVIILRLWRFFKIIEEFSVGAEEQLEGLQMQIEGLEMENEGLRRRLRDANIGDEEQQVGFRLRD